MSEPLVYRLPAELVSHIFYVGIPDLDFSTYASVRRSQVVAGSICSWWRQVCHQTPLLWTSISFVYEQRTDGQYQLASESMLEGAIKRSGSLELDVIVIDDKPSEEYQTDIRVQPETHLLLLSILHRTKKLCLIGNPKRMTSPLTNIFPIQGAHCLRELRLHQIGYLDQPPLVVASEGASPLLDTIIIRNSSHFLLPCGLKQLKSFVGNSCSVFWDDATLTGLVSLETLVFWAWGMGGGVPPRSIQWPSSLKILDVRTAHTAGLPAVLALASNLVHVTFRTLRPALVAQAPDPSWLALPALRSLTISILGTFTPWVIGIIKRAPNLVAIEANAQLALQLMPLFDLPDASAAAPPNIVPNVTLVRIFDYPVHLGAGIRNLRATEGHMRAWATVLQAPRSPALQIHWYDGDPAAMHFRSVMGAPEKALPSWVSIKYYKSPLISRGIEYSHPFPALSTIV